MLVSAALLAVLVSRVDVRSLLPEHPRPGNLAFLVCGLATAAFGVVLSAWRWQHVLTVYGIIVPLRKLTSHYFAGQFVGNVLPSTIGGDVLRVTRLSTGIGSRRIAFGSVALERLTGFVALPILVLAGFALRPSLLDHGRAWIALALAGAAVVALVVILLVAGHPRLAGRFRDHENWMRFIGAVHEGVDRMRREPGLAGQAIGTALVYQLSTIVVVWCAVHTLGVEIPTAAVLAFAPAVAMAQVLPLSISGLGVREGMLVVLLHPLGVPSGRAVAVGLLWYALMLVVSICGAPAFAVGHRRARTPGSTSADAADAADVPAGAP